MMWIYKCTLVAVHLHPDGKQIPVRRKQRKQMQFKNLQTQTVPAIIHCNYHTYHFLQQCTRKNNSLNFIKSCIQMRKKNTLCNNFKKTKERPFFKDVPFFQRLQHIQICKRYIIQLRHADVFCALTNQWCWIDSISRRKIMIHTTF